MYPLSSSQMGIYAGWAAYPQTTGYNLPAVVPFPCTVDADRLAGAMQRIADTREVLHTRICTDAEGRPCQYADMQMPVVVQRMQAGEAEAQYYIAHNFVRPFAIDGSEPLARFAVIVTPQHHYLLIDIHHIIADGLTIVHSLLGIDLPQAYTSLGAGGRVQGAGGFSWGQGAGGKGQENTKPQVGTGRALSASKGSHRHIADRARPVPTSSYEGYVSDSQHPTSQRSTFNVQRSTLLYQSAVEEEQRCQGDEYRRAADYQRTRFAGVPFARLSAEVTDAWGATIRRSACLDRGAVDAWCAAHGLTPNLLLMGAFGLVLARWCRHRRIAFTVINHGRRGRRYADAYGMFVRSAPVIADTRGVSVMDYIRSMRGELNSTVRYAVYPFTHFCRDMGVTPDVAFGFQAGVQEMVTLDGCSVQGCQLMPPMTRSDLSCMVYLTDNQYEVRMESSEALNPASTLQTLADAVRWTVGNMMAHPDVPLADIAIVSHDEEQRLLALSKGERMEYDENDTFLLLFLRQVQRTPEAPAVTDDSGSLTYGQLAACVEARAAALSAAGYTRGQLVAVEARQNKEYLIDVIAAWHIGACVEVRGKGLEVRDMSAGQGTGGKGLSLGAGCRGQENTTPQVGTGRALSASGEPHRHIADRARPVPTSNHEGYAPDSHHSTFNLQPSTFNHCPNSPEIAYVIYTSGSTGEPKGVMVSQQALTHFIHFIVSEWHLTVHSRIACHASVAFDASVEDLFPVLTTGGQLFVVPEADRRDPDRLYRYLAGHGITGCCMTTQWGVLMAERYDLPLDYLCLGGERLLVVPPFRGRLINTYGPTEMTVDATYCELVPGRSYDTIPIGRPLPDLAAYVVDTEGHLLPQGATGELWMAGPQMAEGYLGDEALTAQRFTPCRFAEGRAYHTGDLVRWNAEGLLEFVGRADRQVKLRGYRIEPGQVEHAIVRVPGVLQAAVVVRMVGSEQRLCAYFAASRTIAAAEMRDALAAVLPAYMVPTAYMQLPRLPLTQHDKVNLEALPVITMAVSDADYVAPATRQERLWCDLFARVLGVERVGVTDDFFALGGTSLTAVRLLTAAAEQGLRLTYDQIYEHPTPRGLSAGLPLGAGGKGHSSGAGCRVQGAGDYSPNGDDYCPNSQTPRLPDSPEDDYCPNSQTPRLPNSPKDDYCPNSQTPRLPNSQPSNLHPSTFNLLTGATGFLGIHVLRELLERACHVVCLVRADDDAHALARLLDAWQWYFPAVPCPQPSVLTAIAADITAASFASVPLAGEVTGAGLFIHCAADVRQYAPAGQLWRTNVEGTRHVIDLCLRHRLQLAHISTIAVDTTPQVGTGRALSASGQPQYQLMADRARPVPTSNHDDYCPNSQTPKLPNSLIKRLPDSPTPYLQSKAEAERVVSEAVRQERLQAQILRVGNLTARQSDGVFQRHAETNAFHLLAEALQALGCYPTPLADVVVDLSPVDVTARRLADALAQPFDGRVTDLSSPDKATVGALARGWQLQPVGIDEFIHSVGTSSLTDIQRMVTKGWLHLTF